MVKDLLCVRPHRRTVTKRLDKLSGGIRLPVTRRSSENDRDWPIRTEQVFQLVDERLLDLYRATSRLLPSSDHEFVVEIVGRRLRPVRSEESNEWIGRHTNVSQMATSSVVFRYVRTRSLEFSPYRTCNTPTKQRLLQRAP